VPLVSLRDRWFGRGRTSATTLAIAVAAGVLLVVVPLVVSTVRATAAAPPGGVTLTEVGYRAPGDGWLLLTLATIVAKLALVAFEEVAFRGALLDVLKARLGGPAAVVAAALVFGAAHAARAGDTSHALVVAITFLDGIGYGVAALATSSLWTPIAWHFAKNVAVWQLTGTSTLEFAPGLFTMGQGSTTLVDVVSAAVVVALAAPIIRRLAAAPLVTHS
jgi:membrane protease YdiL (CAAX protease family)